MDTFADKTRNTIIIGLGSWHGDDQVGWQLVEWLCEHRKPMPLAIALEEPTRMIEYLDECEHLVIIDACLSGFEIAAWHALYRT